MASAPPSTITVTITNTHRYDTVHRQVLASATVSKAGVEPAHASLLGDIVAGLMPSGARPATAETFLPSSSTSSTATAAVGESASPRDHQVSTSGGNGVKEGQPRRVALCALPEDCSRHNCPAQPHAITDCMRSISGSGSVSIVMCLADSSHAFAASW